ncbi:MAG: hypothetical protein KF837_41050 [Labilithrix sp.]|nr:hypothetical protein [Labilithrix sp.]
MAALLVGCTSADVSDRAPAGEDPLEAPATKPASGGDTAPSSGAADEGPKGPLRVAVVEGARDGIPVLFHDAEGVVIGQTKTDAEGIAIAPDELAPAQVSALLGDGEHHLTVSWVGVARGDVLRVKNLARPTSGEGSFQLTPPGDVPGAEYYAAADGRCFGGPPLYSSNGTAPLSYYSCWSDKNAAIVRAANTNDGVVAFSFVKGLPSPTTHGVPVKLETWVTPAKLVLDTVSVPDGMNAFTTMRQDIDGVLHPTDGQSVRNADGTYGTMREFLVPPGLAERYVGRSDASRQDPDGGHRNVLSIERALVDASSGSTIDFARALPEITSVTSNGEDPKRPALSWASVAPIADADGGVISFGWGTSSFSVGGPMGYSPDSGAWRVYVPPGSASVKLPILPAEYAAWLPLEGTMRGSVRFDAIDDFDGYAAYRQAIGGESSWIGDQNWLVSPGTITPKQGDVRSSSRTF